MAEGRPDHFVFFKSYYDAYEVLPKRQRNAFIVAIMQYVFDDVTPELHGSAQVAFSAVKGNVDASLKRARISRENGSLGGRPKKPSNNQRETQTKPSNNQRETQTKPKKTRIGEDRRERPTSLSLSQLSQLPKTADEENRGAVFSPLQAEQTDEDKRAALVSELTETERIRAGWEGVLATKTFAGKPANESALRMATAQVEICQKDTAALKAQLDALDAKPEDNLDAD